MKAIGRHRVKLCQALMKSPACCVLGLIRQATAQFQICGRSIKQTIDQRFEVERGAADKQRPLVPRLNKADTVAGFLQPPGDARRDRKSTRLNSSHTVISYAVFCLKKKKKQTINKNLKP